MKTVVRFLLSSLNFWGGVIQLLNLVGTDFPVGVRSSGKPSSSILELWENKEQQF